MLRALALACCLSGCHIVFDLDTVAVRSDGGGAGDDDMGGGDANDSGLPCYGGGARGGFISVCLAPTTEEWLGVADIDTDGPICDLTQQSDGRELCVITASTIMISAAVRVHGSRPLVLVATDLLSLAAALKVNSTNVGAGRLGPGANPSMCDLDGGNGASGGATGGGGAGGTFGGLGGRGGTGDGTMGGAPQAVAIVANVLRGGCPGGAGGRHAGSGGAGGGAVYLIAGTQLSITGGLIDASGMGGIGGEDAGDGAGGGGSGGMIVLDAPSISLNTAKLIAHGAGGGGGAGDVFGGMAGGEVNFTPTQYASAGGIGGDQGGGGGGGGSTVSSPGGIAGATGLASAGGGGGGGGHGVIKIFGQPTESNSTVSPVPLI